jgi:hypothetical protein
MCFKTYIGKWYCEKNKDETEGNIGFRADDDSVSFGLLGVKRKYGVSHREGVKDFNSLDRGTVNQDVRCVADGEGDGVEVSREKENFHKDSD